MTEREQARFNQTVVALVSKINQRIDDAFANISLGGGGGAGGGHGQCYLSKSGTNLLLSPENGNQLIINSAAQTIPDAGVTLAPPAVASTTYYIYAYISGGNITLEASATVPAVQAGLGVKIKNGDATRTLVGMGRTNAANAWVDSNAQRFVLSYFNRKNKKIENTYAAQRTVVNQANFTEFSTTEHTEFLTWGDETVILAAIVSMYVSVASGGFIALAYDGTTPDNLGGIDNGTSAPLIFGTAGISNNKLLSEGYHYGCIVGRNYNVACTIYIGAATPVNGNKSGMDGIVRG